MGYRHYLRIGEDKELKGVMLIDDTVDYSEFQVYGKKVQKAYAEGRLNCFEPLSTISAANDPGIEYVNLTYCQN